MIQQTAVSEPENIDFDAMYSSQHKLNLAPNYEFSMRACQTIRSTCSFDSYIFIYVSPKMRTVPVRELGSQFAN